MAKPLVTDAANEKQYKAAIEKELSDVERARRGLAKILSTPEGREYLWRLMARAGTFETVWDNSARIHYNAGQQDFGRSILTDILDAGEQFYFDMMTENRKDKP